MINQILDTTLTWRSGVQIEIGQKIYIPLVGTMSVQSIGFQCTNSRILCSGFYDGSKFLTPLSIFIPYYSASTVSEIKLTFDSLYGGSIQPTILCAKIVNATNDLLCYTTNQVDRTMDIESRGVCILFASASGI